MALASFLKSLVPPSWRRSTDPPAPPPPPQQGLLPDGDLKQQARATVEKIKTAYLAGRFHLLPWLDRWTEETEEIRERYREMLREPTLAAALHGQVSAVASQDCQVHPEDPDDPREVQAARAALYALKKVHGGSSLLPVGNGPRHIAQSILNGAVIDGWSLCEVTLRDRPEKAGPAAGKVLWETFKAKDTQSVQLVTDRYWGVTGIRALRYNPGIIFEGADLHSFVLFNRFSLFEHPIGTSAFRAAYRAFVLKDLVHQLRYVHLERFTTPYLKGTYTGQEQRAALEEALEEARARSWISIPAGVLVEAMDIAGRGTADYEKALESLDREMLTAVCGAYLHMMASSAGDPRGSSEVQKETTELFQWALSADLGDTVTTQMLRPWYEFNYHDMAPGTCTWGAVSEQAMQARANLDKTLQDIGLELSKKEAYAYYGRQRPAGKDDVLSKGGPGGGGGGGPGEGGSPFDQPPGGGDEGGGGGEDEGPADPWSFGESPEDWHAPWEDLSCFAESDWVAHTIKSGPRKGQSVFKNTKTGKLSDTKPGGKEKPEGGGKKPPAKKPPAPGKPPKAGKLTVDAAHAHLQQLIKEPPKDMAAAVTDVVERLSSGLLGRELDELAARLEAKPGGKTKADKARRLVEGLLAGPKKPPAKKPPPAAKPPAKGKAPPFEAWKPGEDSSAPAHAARVAAFTALPPGQRGGAGSPLRGLMRDEYSAMKQLKEFEDGVIKIPKLYRFMKADLPSLTPEEFRAELEAMAGQEGPEGRAQLHAIERPREAGIDVKGGLYHDPDGVMPRRGSEYLGNLIWPDPRPGATHPPWQPPGAAKVKPPAAKKPPAVEPPPPTPPPAKPPEATPGRPQPKPPEPLFTGTDSLGRKWVNGKLVPGEPEPPKGRPPAVVITPGRRFDLTTLTGGEPVHTFTPEEEAALKATGLGGWMSDLNDFYARKHAAEVKVLQAAGVLEPYSKYTPDGAQKLTAKGKVALAAWKAGTTRLPDPTSTTAIQTWSRLYGRLEKDPAARQAIRDHFGITRQPTYDDGSPRDYSSYDLQTDLETAALLHHNGGRTVAQRIREAGALHDTVARLTDVTGGAAEARAALKDRERELARQIPPVIASNLYGLKDSIAWKEASLKFPGFRPPGGRKQFRADLEKARQVQAEFERVIEERARLNDVLYGNAAAHHEKVSEVLREGVKDPEDVVVAFGPETGPNATAAMSRAVSLLRGVLQRSPAGWPKFTTYIEPTAGDRAHHQGGGGESRIHLPEVSGELKIRTSVRTCIHEILHGIESADPGIAAAVQEFRAYRVGDEQGRDLADFGMPGEVGYKDNFDRIFPTDGGAYSESDAYYTGKHYSSDSTEILTMLGQQLWVDPEGFARRDPEGCAFVVGVLNGTLRSKPVPLEDEILDAELVEDDEPLS